VVQDALPTCLTDADACSKLSEVELQRACAPLYPPMAVDALANIVLFFFFFQVALLTHVRGKLRSPMRALGRLVVVFVKDYFTELWETVKSIPYMGRMPLAARLRCCSNIDKAISVVSTSIPLIAITRFLNIGNVNGARWVGYALTCPFMQMELLILIAPVVPCYTLNTICTFALTFYCLIMAWVSSVMTGDLYNGYIGDFLSSGDLDALDLNPKGWVIMPAMIGMATLCFLQVPYLGFLYTCRGSGGRRDDMPDDYRLMLLTVMVTWALFPLWWLFSWEGASIFSDAKSNELGFMFLNMLAKGTFIWQSSRMSDKFQQKYPDRMDEEMSEVPDIVSKKHSMYRRRNSALLHTLERFASEAHSKAVESNSQSPDAYGKHFSLGDEEKGELPPVQEPAPPSATEIMLKELIATVNGFEKEMAETKKAAEDASNAAAAVAAAAPAHTERGHGDCPLAPASAPPIMDHIIPQSQPAAYNPSTGPPHVVQGRLQQHEVKARSSGGGILKHYPDNEEQFYLDVNDPPAFQGGQRQNGLLCGGCKP